jgi:nitrite reductase (NADH) large subunit
MDCAKKSPARDSSRFAVLANSCEPGRAPTPAKPQTSWQNLRVKGDTDMAHYVIVGNGVAGTKAASAIRSADAAAEITILSADDRPFYLRPKLADFVSGKIPETALAGKTPDFYTKNGIKLRLNIRVAGLDPAKQQLKLASGASVSYDSLLIATGVRPAKPDFPGRDLDGVVTLKTFADAVALKSRLSKGRRVVVLGEGLLGLEIARACRESDAEVTYLLRGERFWPEVLDDDGAALVERRLQDKNITLRTTSGVAEALGSSGRLRYLILTDGATIPADLLCLGAGLVPDIDFLQGSGIATAKGVIVDDTLATSIPGVYAAGDAAEQPGGYDLGWLRAWEQGALAGANMAGAHMATPRKHFSRVPVLSLQAYGMDLMAIGLSNPEPKGTEFRRIATDPTQIGVYKKLSLLGDVVVGALLVGDIGDASAVEKIVREKALIGQVDPLLIKRLFDPYYWESAGKEILCPVCKFGIRLGTEAKEGDTITCPICGEEFQLENKDGRLTARRA